MSRKERGRPESGVIRMGTSAKDAEVLPAVDCEPIIELGGANEMGVVTMGTAAQPAEVLGKVVRAGSGAKWVRVREVRK